VYLIAISRRSLRLILTVRRDQHFGSGEVARAVLPGEQLASGHGQTTAYLNDRPLLGRTPRSL
jgi:hypothetical protein